MSYRVTAPLVLARDKEGKVHERYQDAVIDWLDDDQKQHLLEAKFVEQVSGPTPVEVGNEAPLHAAPKAEWVKFAISKGADPVEAEATNKPDLIELYGG